MAIVRRPQPGEYDSVRALIEAVSHETFGDLFAPNPVPLECENEDWQCAWVAVSDGKIVGVILTNEEWVSDLWVLRDYRKKGLGRELLAEGEAEISARGQQDVSASRGSVKFGCRAILFQPGLEDCA